LTLLAADAFSREVGQQQYLAANLPQVLAFIETVVQGVPFVYS